MASQINRITLFKIPKPEDVEGAVAKYAGLATGAKKNGAPYILSARAGRTHSDPRNQGFTLVAQTAFASLEDMRFYDNECEAHKEIKAFLKPRAEGVLMVYMDAATQAAVDAGADGG